MEEPSRETLERAYAAAFWAGLIDRLEVAKVRDLRGEDSNEFSMAHIKHDSALALARDSIHEVSHPVNRAAWTGYIDGSRRYAAIGSPSLPTEFVVEEASSPRYDNVFEIVYDELNGWMPGFNVQIPQIVEMIKLGVRGVDDRSELSEVFSFFEMLVRGVDDVSGNFGDGFTDEDRWMVNQYVGGDWTRAAELIERAWLKGEGEHVCSH